MLGLGLGVGRIVASGGGTGIVQQLFGNGEQGFLYVVSPQHLWQDAAGTVPVTTDGDPVGRMDDLSGNGNHATQSTAANRPVYHTDGALHWLQFDETLTHFIEFPTAAMPLGAELRFNCVGMRTPETTGGSQFITNGPATIGNKWDVAADTSGGSGAVRVEVQGDNIIGTAVINDALPHVVTAYTMSGTLSDAVIRVDKAADAQTSPGSSALDTQQSGEHNLGKRATDPFDGRIYAAVQAMPGAVMYDQATVDLVERYFAQRCGVA